MRQGPRRLFTFIELAAWGVFNQSYGAAFVYPLYCLAHLHEWRHAEAGTVSGFSLTDPNDSEALFYTSIINALMPMWLLYPAFVSCNSETRQLLIASYRATPIVLAGLHPFLSSMIRLIRGPREPHKRGGRLIRYSLFATAATATSGYWYDLAVVASSQDAGFFGALSPWLVAVDPSRWVFVAQGCHRFLRYDMMVILLAITPYATLVLNASDKARTRFPGTFHNETSQGSRLAYYSQRLLGMSMVAIVVSPGAVLPLALATHFGLT
ncbi:putative Asperlin biosynthesis cluster protein G [Seiridium cardinale]